MVTEAGKELLRNTINTAKFHNRILEENEMWKQWELECGLTMMVSDDDIIKRIKKNHQCSKHRRRDKSRSRDSSRSKYEMSKIRQRAGSSNDRWDHSGFAELYPDAAVPDKYPSTSFSTIDRHKKKKKKSRHRSDSSDEEIWEEFKRPAQFWNRERTLRLIELLRDAPALWNNNYPGYRDPNLILKETKRMALEFRVDEDEIMKKIAILIEEFHMELEKLTESKGTSSKFSESEWFAYKHMTFLIRNKNERYCKTVKNLRKGKNPQWVDSSDSYSDSEDEKSQPTTNQLSHHIRSKVQDEKRDVRGKKVNYTCINLSSYSNSEDETSRLSANQSSYFIKSKVKDEKKDVYRKKANFTCINLSSDSEVETSRPSVNQSSCSFKSEVQNEKRDVHEKKANCTETKPILAQTKEADTCINLPYVQAYMAQRDSFSVYGEIVAHRMRKAKKSSKAVARAESEINSILRKYETGFFDSPEDTFK